MSLVKCKLTSNKNTLLKIVILGDGGVGKSCLMGRFVSNSFDIHSFHTVGVEFLNKDIEVEGETYTLQIWDTAGQERFKSLRTPFYRGSDICMLTYAVNDKNTFKSLTIWKNEFIYYADIKDEDNFPFIVVGNKSDVPLNQKQVSLNDLEKWCTEHNIRCSIETSACTNTNVKEAFCLAVKEWINFVKINRDKCEDEDKNWGETLELTQVNEEIQAQPCCS